MDTKRIGNTWCIPDALRERIEPLLPRYLHFARSDPGHATILTRPSTSGRNFSRYGTGRLIR